MSNRLYNAAISNEAVYRPMKLITKPVVVIAGILLAALLLAPTFSVSAQTPPERSYRYAENRTDPVATFRANTDVEWSLTGADVNDFDIDNGVLEFKSSPNYEVPTSSTAETNTGTLAEQNVYSVTIVATSEGISADLVNATITVINVDDLGKATLDHLQPAEDVEFTATVSDEDDGQKTDPPVGNRLDPAIAKWKWERSQSGTSGWTLISGRVDASYTPVSADVGYYLRVTATYSNRDLTTDPVANAPIRTARAVSEYPVKAHTNTNQAPEFADTITALPDGTLVPGTQQTRSVDEEDKKALVGAAVSATDAGDVLKYTWTPGLEDDRDEFSLDEETGQISVKDSLDHETVSTQGNPPAPAGTRYVNVTATDPFRSSDTVEVRITVTDVNDAPVLADIGSKGGAVVENTTTLVDDPVTDETETFNYSATDVDNVDADNDGTIEDSEREAVTLSIAGPDAKYFENSDNDGDASTLTLALKSDTDVDFETKKSYSVTVVAKDDRGKTTTRDVTIKVNNAEDDGSIKLSTLQPQVGVPITASLSDEDGVKGSIQWQWGVAAGAALDDNGKCPTAGNIYTNLDIGNTSDRDNKATFTPTAVDVGDPFTATCIAVTATYADGFPETTPPEINTPNLVQAAAYPVLPVRRANKAPRFEDEEGDRITSDTRSVAENEKTVPKAVTATDPDDGTEYGATPVTLNDNLTHSLHGTDASSFTIDPESGQISVKGKLDYETKQTHSVVVRATDGSRATANISVTITVTDVNEKPEVSGPAGVTYTENGTDNVGTYTADDPENDAVIWSVSTDTTVSPDGGKFDISSGGVLTFLNSPNYDTPGDADGNNMYEVTVVATDTVDKQGTRKVDVTVTNEDDLGSISFNVVQPGVGVEITATPKDEDTADMIESATLQWASGDSSDGPFTEIENATKAAYTPNSDDAGKYLQLTADYGAKDNPKSVSASFDHATAGRDVANPVPVFPDQNLATPDDFETAQERSVPENSKAGTAVGDPVTATDDDVLTYTIHDAADTTEGQDAQYFSIDKASGQIKVSSAGAASTQLNYEGGDTVNRYVVTVRATDANGAMAEIQVTIIVTDVDEKPTLTSPENAADVFKAPENQKLIDADGVIPAGAFTVDIAATYTVGDPDTGTNDSATLSVEGADGDKFTISGGTLAFKSDPDFEGKESAAGTNIYKVTVVATDQAGNRRTKNATIEVTNVDEDGSIKLSTVQPQVGVPLTATLTDPDGVVGATTWTWSQGGTDVPTATKATFTPTATGELLVEVDYEDSLSDASAEDDKRNIEQTTGADENATAKVSRTYVIRPMRTSNSRPEFQDDEGNRYTSTTREIEENATILTVGEAVDARDTNNTADDGTTAIVNHLTYTLGGPDASSFTINRGEPATNGATATAVNTAAGQISAKKAPDYETQNVYSVTVTATDGSGASATVSVTINVTDVANEPPELVETPPNVEPEFAEATYEREVTESMTTGRNVGAPVRATDENAGDTLSYELSGDDADAFEISSSGQITTNEALDVDTQDEYTVTVTVDDGNEGTATAEVTITVTPAPLPVFDDGDSASRSVAENSAAGANVGDPVTATVPEGNVTYALGGDDADSFAIGTTDGQITVGEGTALDFEARDSYSVSVTATNETGGEASIDVAIAVENVNEAGTLTLSSVSPAFGEELTATLEDPDGGITDVSWEWQWSENRGDMVDCPWRKGCGLHANGKRRRPAAPSGGRVHRRGWGIERGKRSHGSTACAATAADANTGTTGAYTNTGTTSADANTGTTGAYGYSGTAGTYGYTGTAGTYGYTGTAGAYGNTGTAG